MSIQTVDYPSLYLHLWLSKCFFVSRSTMGWFEESSMKSGFYRKDPKLLLLSRVTLVSFIVQLSFLKMLNCQYRYGSKHLLIRHLGFFILVLSHLLAVFFLESTTQVKASEMVAVWNPSYIVHIIWFVVWNHWLTMVYMVDRTIINGDYNGL